MSVIWLQPLETSMNAYLHLDPDTQERLRALAPAVLTIELLPFQFLFQMEVTESGVKLHLGDLLPTETKITGTPLQLIQAVLDKSRRHSFFADDVTITGNAELSRQVIELFDELEIDWEDILAGKIGDAPAYHLKRGFDSVRDFMQQTARRVSADINEYLHEEKQWFPVKEALLDFFNDIDQVRMQVDRLEVRLQTLRQRQKGK